MAAKLVQTNEVQDYLKLVSGLTNTIGKARVKQIVHRIVSDLFQAIEDLEITPEEFWTGVSYINDLGAAGGGGVVGPGVGVVAVLRPAPGGRRREWCGPSGAAWNLRGAPIVRSGSRV